MQYPKIPLAQTIVLLCKAKNIQHIVISPGSRNAPVTIGFTHDDYFTCYSIVDERCAAFFALGIAQQIQKPVAVVCSSGSALLNYYPAIAEAYYSHIPLVVLSADRPKHLIGIGDGQTINQTDVYKNHIIYTANLSSQMDAEFKNRDEDEPAILKTLENKLERFLGRKQELQQENETEINKALNKALSKRGPVHINMPFHEPLYELTDALSVNPKIIELNKRASKVDDFIYNECLDAWNSAAKKMVLVGVNPPNELEQKWLDELVKDNSVIVFTETTSNIHNPGLFNSIDTMIAPLEEDDFKALQPDILLTFGGLVVSKKIKAFLRSYQPKQHWHIDRDYANDTFFCLEKHIETTPNNFFETFLPQITHFVKSDYKATWEQIRHYRKEKHSNYLNEIPFSDFQVFEALFKSLPHNLALQLGNSSTIRYAQLFDIHKSINVFCNRGTSGIDGSTSTAIGCAVGQEKQTVLITGDLSFFYDSNALWNNYIPNNFRIIIVNNQGGGIFRILPGNKDSENFENFFETTHDFTAKQLATMYGFQYGTAANAIQLKNKLKDFYKESDQPKILEIFTPRTENDEVLLNYFKFIK
ncbi:MULTISPECIES: 2-succinyl-5-enolpyruvyl-6-hydroxy-3-cyclohexene-1-carboxylate synthase [Bizionia]|uniref:2-succinyl-5-enolpyruvyl-6-hydroxy-3-cyclohexene-1-carboxylate synthase n=1 Tax=Bizionia algoritergicola TaxID=291187 RepID=A0A5D0QX61_9FLAO|nr:MULTISPECIES: 2-succinyl-5-enolpyruvyl-6-hydroxy-3-cyclohexene-1-carboxylate synthase [Bizionia]OBX21734.1 2-succinyl-5-enolpyruvyl-6-hydroxy-3-cyclohexene-1-carboxylate synthase [Bizionia sp. APA-3]TYB73459.1 2-succinyl-5-enolpyruvyl-6-hydroxy-3-cyclohexene-1-carboxylate synthase [Bizionia algoritergicola]